MKIIHIIDSTSIWSGKIFRWAALLLSMVVIYEVASRYLFNNPTVWAFDLAMYFYSMLYLLGGAYVLWEGSHIRVDVLFNQFSKRTQAVIDIIFYVVFFFPYVSVMVWWGYKAAFWSWKAEEISNTSQWGEQIYLWKALIPIGFFLMLLQGIAELVRTIGKLRRDTNGA
ncbi:TRAP transporter small permease subunit [Desulfotignum balticum]|uniref:TRAP transporter small permease subunit n=1 Tax=Desulfotignum balticum TaxID=115781 RepID=UPI0003F4F613|nr:TRAP transporter small permease subunit [Desulfotignum balticum]